MAYQLPHETSTKRKFNDYAAASTARMRHNEILFNSSLVTPIQFFVRRELKFRFRPPITLSRPCVSRSVIKKQASHGCVCHFIDYCKTLFTNPTTIYRQFAPIFFEFCTIL
ncbi:hypothetical protein MTR67_038396 [Solanum verrucosum]|uniref:Uncharacterized protein n=1 Tax=Solanum verrucosum TaxID=315347 RepID=A0AAF0UGF6_SOLVR|nr:hypothetical protein MTR67_038396 [Solanum verrucosum]